MNINWKKNTALFLAGQALSLFGTMVVQYAITWHITLKTQSGSMMTLFTIAGFLPMFFISPFAGVWADRFNRKYIINIADGTVAFVSLLAAVSIMAGIDNTAILLLCAVIRSLGQGVQMPAVGAFIPDIVPQEQLTRINGFQSSIQSFITLTAPVISGAMMTFAPLETLFFLDIITAIIGISIVLFFVKAPEKEKLIPNATGQESTAYFHDLKEGMKYIRKHGYVLRIIIFSAIFLFFFSPAALLTPLQVARNFGSDVWRLSAIEIAFSIGMMAGGILIGVWGGFKNRIYTMALSCALCGLLAAGLGLAPHFAPYLVIMAILGVLLPLWNAPSMVLLQTTVEAAFMGRVLSVFTMVSGAMMPLGMVVFGPVADLISIDILLIGTGIVVALLCIPMITNKTLLEAGRAHLQNGGTLPAA
ncbi:MAG: MFS transporter [Spirochaetaceae bacterium]|jgi:DHA3 family macrolide efflux protein-like MFS transporter|nr:MFS transporter [Spirochaetaceae bacterium]